MQLGRQIGAWKCALPQPGKVIAAPIYDADIHRGDVCRMSGPRVPSREGGAGTGLFC